MSLKLREDIILSIAWSMMSKVADRSRRMSMEYWFKTLTRNKSLKTFIKAVSVESKGKKARL